METIKSNEVNLKCKDELYELSNLILVDAYTVTHCSLYCHIEFTSYSIKTTLKTNSPFSADELVSVSSESKVEELELESDEDIKSRLV